MYCHLVLAKTGWLICVVLPKYRFCYCSIKSWCLLSDTYWNVQWIASARRWWTMASASWPGRRVAFSIKGSRLLVFRNDRKILLVDTCQHVLILNSRAVNCKCFPSSSWHSGCVYWHAYFWHFWEGCIKYSKFPSSKSCWSCDMLHSGYWCHSVQWNRSLWISFANFARGWFSEVHLIEWCSK